MIIGTSGFSWSGSSAVSDLLKEVNGIQVYDKIEFLIAYFPDGLEDLDYHLNTNCSKFLSSVVAINRFRKVVNYLLNDITGGKINQLTDEYLDKLIQVRWKGLAQGQACIHNMWLYDHFGEKFMFKFLRHLPPKICKALNIYPIDTLEFSIAPDNFQDVTLEYVDSILETLGLDLSKPIVLDQPFAGNDPGKSLKYFRDSKAIIVDRDPRDLYLLAKEYFPKRSYQIPYEKVDDFILYYKNMHKNLADLTNGNSNILYINFESLIYDYQNTVDKIMHFLQINHHDHPKRNFIPEESMINTRLFMKCKKYSDDVRKIESYLSGYLFDFMKYKDTFSSELKNISIFDEKN